MLDVRAWCAHPDLRPAGGTGAGARAAAGTSTPRTGSAGPRGTCTTWPASPASPARGSCPPGRSSPWWRRRCSAGCTTTACWTTWSGPWRKVRESGPSTHHRFQEYHHTVLFYSINRLLNRPMLQMSPTALLHFNIGITIFALLSNKLFFLHFKLLKNMWNKQFPFIIYNIVGSKEWITTWVPTKWNVLRITI